MAEDSFIFVPAYCSRDCEAATLGHSTSQEAKGLAKAALTQAQCAGGLPAKKAKLGRAAQDRCRSPLQEAKQETGSQRDMIAMTIEQRLSRLEGATQRLKGATQRLEAKNQRLEADTQAVKFESEQLGREQRRQARMMRWNNTVLRRGEPAFYESRKDLASAAARFQTWQRQSSEPANYSREQTLAFVGISRYRTAQDGKQIIDMVEGWKDTNDKVLTRQQKMKITRHFDHNFVRFLAITSENDDMLTANSRAHTIDINSWEERFFLMEAIDSSQTPAVREYGRAAYGALFGSSSWEDERQRVKDKLACREVQ